jgi:hypothetical protein
LACEIPPGPPFSKGGAVQVPFPQGEQLLGGLGPAQPGRLLKLKTLFPFYQQNYLHNNPLKLYDTATDTRGKEVHTSLKNLARKLIAS